MAVRIAVTITFNGDPHELSERFESARLLWIEAQQADYERPVFYAVCRGEGGIVIVSAWETAAGHRAFGHSMEPHLEAVGMRKPDRIERMRIEKLGWD